MNRIIKSPNVPEKLAEKGPALTQELCDKDVTQITSQDFDENVYKSAKGQLRIDQHQKCAYCERHLNGDYGHVEHYRPKTEYKPTLDWEEKNGIHPAYYWLAYDWNNLLCSCSECNTSYKQVYFPLADEKQRDIAHRNISKEEPLIINPAAEDPGAYIAFRKHVAVARIKDGKESRKGRTTIELFKLNDRPLLLQKRMVAWKAYSDTKRLLDIGYKSHNEEIIAFAQRNLKHLTNEDAEFTGMFKYQD